MDTESLGLKCDIQFVAEVSKVLDDWSRDELCNQDVYVDKRKIAHMRRKLKVVSCAFGRIARWTPPLTGLQYWGQYCTIVGECMCDE